MLASNPKLKGIYNNKNNNNHKQSARKAAAKYSEENMFRLCTVILVLHMYMQVYNLKS